MYTMDSLIVEAVEVIALQGVQGCHLPQLFELLETQRVVHPPIDDGMRSYVRHHILQSPDIQCCRPSKQMTPVKKKAATTKKSDPPVLLTVIDKHHLSQYPEAEIILVGTEIYRHDLLHGHRDLPFALVPLLIQILELIGKARDHGIKQTDLSRAIQMDPKSLHFQLKTLESTHLIVRRPYEGEGQRTSLVFLPRFAARFDRSQEENEDTPTRDPSSLTTSEDNNNNAPALSSALLQKRILDTLRASPQQALLLVDLKHLLSLKPSHKRIFDGAMIALLKQQLVEKFLTQVDQRLVRAVHLVQKTATEEVIDQEAIIPPSVDSEEKSCSSFSSVPCLSPYYSLEEQVYAVIERQGPLTSRQLMTALHLGPKPLLRACQTLVDAGLLQSAMAELAGRERHYQYSISAQSAVHREHTRLLGELQSLLRSELPSNSESVHAASQRALTLNALRRRKTLLTILYRERMLEQGEALLRYMRAQEALSSQGEMDRRTLRRLVEGLEEEGFLQRRALQLPMPATGELVERRVLLAPSVDPSSEQFMSFLQTMRRHVATRHSMLSQNDDALDPIPLSEKSYVGGKRFSLAAMSPTLSRYLGNAKKPPLAIKEDYLLERITNPREKVRVKREESNDVVIEEEEEEVEAVEEVVRLEKTGKPLVDKWRIPSALPSLRSNGGYYLDLARELARLDQEEEVEVDENDENDENESEQTWMNPSESASAQFSHQYDPQRPRQNWRAEEDHLLMLCYALFRAHLHRERDDVIDDAMTSSLRRIPWTLVAMQVNETTGRDAVRRPSQCRRRMMHLGKNAFMKHRIELLIRQVRRSLGELLKQPIKEKNDTTPSLAVSLREELQTMAVLEQQLDQPPSMDTLNPQRVSAALHRALTETVVHETLDGTEAEAPVARMKAIVKALLLVPEEDYEADKAYNTLNVFSERLLNEALEGLKRDGVIGRVRNDGGGKGGGGGGGGERRLQTTLSDPSEEQDQEKELEGEELEEEEEVEENKEERMEEKRERMEMESELKRGSGGRKVKRRGFHMMDKACHVLYRHPYEARLVQQAVQWCDQIESVGMATAMTLSPLIQGGEMAVLLGQQLTESDEEEKEKDLQQQLCVIQDSVMAMNTRHRMGGRHLEEGSGREMEDKVVWKRRKTTEMCKGRRCPRVSFTAFLDKIISPFSLDPLFDVHLLPSSVKWIYDMCVMRKIMYRPGISERQLMKQLMPVLSRMELAQLLTCLVEHQQAVERRRIDADGEIYLFPKSDFYLGWRDECV